MNFNVNFNSKNVTNLDLKQITRSISRLWEKTHILLFFVILLIFIAYGGYVWRQNIYLGDWSNEKKQEYLNTQSRGVTFKEDDFQKVLSDITSRKEESSKPYQPIKDIFQSY